MAGRAVEKEIDMRPLGGIGAVKQERDMRPLGGIGAVKQERVVVKKEE